ncbi:MAG: hypothetical protein KDK26_13560 [Roseivivax sp.]|nr:hypothetical protein [Roseivivax sp.]
MKASFASEFDQKIDGKGRVSVPAEYRRIIEAEDPDYAEGRNARMIVVRGRTDARQLRCYTVTEHARLTESVDALPPGRQRTLMMRMMASGSQALDIDKDGRIVMPKPLRDKLQVQEGMLTYAGMIKYFEIWPTDLYDQEVRGQVDDLYTEDGEEVDPFDLLD